MRAIEIQRNGYVICKAGAPCATLLTVGLTANIEDTTVGLSVSGMADSESVGDLHLWWMDHFEINDGDELEFALVETEDVTSPNKAEASDSPEFLDRQAEFEKELVKNPPMPRVMSRSHSGVTFKIIKDKEQINAQLEEPREFLSMLLTWNNFGEERGRISVSSFSQIEAFNKMGKKTWMSGGFKLNEKLTVQVQLA